MPQGRLWQHPPKAPTTMFARRRLGRESGLPHDVMRRTSTALAAVLVGSLLSVPLMVTDAAPAQAVSPGGIVFDFDIADPNGFSGNDMRDVSGNGRHATLQSGASLNAAGNAITFSSGWADITSDLPASISWASGVGVSFYADFGAANNHERIFDIGNGSASSNILVSRSGITNTAQLYVNNGTTTFYCTADGAILNSTWAHYAVSYNGSSCTWYRNGAALTTATSGTAVLPPSVARTNAWIGRSNWPADAYFSGSISALTLYNRPLSVREIATNNSMQSCLGSTSTTNGGFIYVAVKSSCTWTAPPGVIAADFLIVGGGGGGGVRHAGGGGGGGVLRLDGQGVPRGAALTVTVGGGGAGRLGSANTGSGSNGSSSSVVISGTTYTAVGGGAGGTSAPGNGGSGGGGYNVGGTGTAGQGNSGGTGGFISSGTSFYFSGGGGGAGAAGSNGTSAGGGKGGDGVGWFSAFTSSVATSLGLSTNQFGGGGGGGIIGEDRVTYPRSGGAGGAGGGGAGGGNQIFNSAGPAGDTGVSGIANTGGGGGGSGLYTSGSANANGGNGGSGVVLIRYELPPSAPTNPSGNTSTNGIVVATTVAAQLDVSWGAPVENSHLITGYQVEYSTDGSNWTVATSSLSASARSFNITGLTSPGPYYVRVAARTGSSVGAYGYPWTEIYRTTDMLRNSSGAFDYSLNKVADGTFTAAATNFTRVRYEMSRTTSGVSSQVFTDFNKTLTNVPTSANLCSTAGCTPGNLNSLGSLQVPSLVGDARLMVRGNVADLTVYSNDLTVSNGSGLSGHLEIWPSNYGAEFVTGVTNYGSATDYDASDRPSAINTGSLTNNYGSFQVHDISSTASPRTVFAWNRHISGGTPEIGFGPAPSGNPDWTFCSNAPATCTTPSTFQLSILVNMPTAVLRTVTFNANFGATPSTATQLIPSGVATRLTANSLTREGFTFVEWTTNANGSGTAYGNSETVTITAETTLFAQWTAITTSNLVVNLDATDPQSLGSSGTQWTSVRPGTSTSQQTAGGNVAQETASGIKSLVFDGSGDYYDYTNVTDTRLSGDISVDMWIKPAALTGDFNILATRWFSDLSGGSGNGAANDWHFAIRQDPSDSKYRLNLFTTGKQNMYGSRDFAANSAWVHVGFSLTSSGALTFYVNGVPDRQHTGATHTAQSTAKLLIGDPRSSVGFPGRISKFRLYGKALSANEMLANFNAEAAYYGQLHTVTFKSNYTGGPADTTQFIGTGNATPLTGNSFTRTGFRFVGWSTTAGGAVEYTDSQTVTISAPLTLHAQWTALCAPTTTYVKGYTVLRFATTGTCSWAVPAGVTTLDALVVGGGGGGAASVGAGAGSAGGGGGGGGAYQANAVPVTAGSAFNIVVGSGGAGGTATGVGQTSAGSQGGDSAFGAITAGGGGGGTCGVGNTGNGAGNRAVCPTGAANVMVGRNGTAAGSGGGASGPWNAFNWGGAGTATAVRVGGKDFAAQPGFIGSTYNTTSAPGGGARGAASFTSPGEGLSLAWTGATAVEYGRGGSSFQVPSFSFRQVTSGFGTGGDGAYSATLGAQAGAAGAQGVVIVRYANTYTVNYEYNEATGGNTRLTNTFTGGDIPLRLPSPTRTGYIFGGWYTDAAFAVDSLVGAADAEYTPNGETLTVTLYAQWTAGAPSITSQPSNQTVNEGERLTLSVGATAPEGVVISYQWQKLGSNSVWSDISGATTETYTVNAVTGSNAGSYRVVVSNAAASASTTSDTAVVTVLLSQSPVTITANRTLVYGSTVTVTASGGQAGLTFGSFSVTGSCTVSGSTITATGMTPCVVSVTKQGDATYAPVTGSVTLAISKATLRVLPDAKSREYGAADVSLTYSVSGLVGSDSASTMLTGITLARTAGTNAGTYTISVSAGSLTSAGNALYTLDTSTTANYVITKRAVTMSIQPVSRPYGQNFTGTYRAVITPALVSGDVASINFSGIPGQFANVGVYTLTPTSVNFTSGSASNYTINFQTSTYTIVRATQTTLTVSNSSSIRYGDTVTLTTSGGSGTGAVTFTVTSGTCSISGTQLTATAVGSCAVTATKAQDTNYNAETSTAFTFTISTRPLIVTAGNKSTVFGQSAPTFTVSGDDLKLGDTLGSATFTFTGTNTTTAPTAAGTYTITPSNVTFSSGSAANYTITYATGSYVISKATPIISLSPSTPLTANFGGTAPALPTPSSASSGPFTWTSSNTAVATISGTTLTIVGGGTAILTVTQAATSDFESATTTITLTVNKVNQASLTYTGPTSTTYGSAIGLTTSGGSGSGAVTWQIVSGPCSIAGSTLTPTGNGNCVVVGTKAGGSNYLDISTAQTTIAVAKKDLVITASNVSIIWGQAPSISFTAPNLVSPDTITALTYTYQGINGTSYAASTTLPTAVGTYSITPTAAVSSALGKYNVSYTAGTLTISKATPVLTAGSAKSTTYAPNLTVTFDAVTSSVTQNAGAITYSSSNAAVATVANPSSPVMTIVGAGSAFLIATQAATDTHRAVSVQVALTVAKADQSGTLTTSIPTSLTYGDTADLAASGGEGTGVYSFSASAGTGACVITGLTVRATKVGTCLITTQREGDNNYNALIGQVETLTVTARPLTISLSQVDFTATGAPGPLPQVRAPNLALGDTVTVTITFSGNGYGPSTTAPSAPNLTPYAVVASDAVFATADIAANYTVTYVVPIEYKVQFAIPNFDWANPPQVNATRLVGASNFVITTTAGSGGAISFVSADPTIAAVNASTGEVTIGRFGTTTITATQEAFGIYDSATITATINVERAQQAPIAITSTSRVQYGSSLTLAITGGSSSATPVFSFVSGQAGPCAINGNVLTATGVGTCSIIATKAADDRYLEGVSESVTVTVTPKPITVSVAPITLSYGSTPSAPVCSVTGLVAGEVLTCSTVTFLATNSTSAPTATGVYAIRPSGITLSPDTSANYIIATSDSTYTIEAVAPTFTVSGGGAWTLPSKMFGDAPFAVTNLSSNNPAPITYSSSDTSVISYDSSTGRLVIEGAGTATITASQAADSNWLAGSESTTVTVAKATQSALTVISVGPAMYGDAYVLTVNGGSTAGAITWTVVSATINGSGTCTVTNGELLTTGAGSCVLRATMAGNDDYQDVTSDDYTIAVQKRTLTITADDKQITFGQQSPTFTSTWVGLATGDVKDSVTFTYSGQSTIPVAVGQYSVRLDTATLTSGDLANYTVVYVPGTYTINRVALDLSGFNNITKTYGDADFDLTDPMTNSDGEFTFTSSDTNVASIQGRRVTIKAVGTVTITASVSPTTNIDGGSITATLTINVAGQASLTISSSASSFQYGQQFTVTVGGGSGTGAISVSASGPCTAGATTSTTFSFTSTGVGTCSFGATKAADSNYTSISTASPLSISITKATLTLTVSSASKSFGGANPTFAASPSGLVGSDAIDTYLWKVNGTTINSSSDLPTDVGEYVLSVTSVTFSPGLASNYELFVVDSTYTITAVSPSLGALTLPTKTYNDAPFTPTSPTSNSSGAWTYASDNSAVATISNGQIVIVGAGSATITATQAAAGNYTQGSVTSTLIVVQAAQAPLLSQAVTIVYGDTVTLVASGGSGTGAYTFATSGSVCSIAGSILTAIGAGSCTVTVGRDSDTNYDAATPITVTITVDKKQLIVRAQDKSTSVGAGGQTPTAQVIGLVGNDMLTDFIYTVDGVLSSTSLPQNAGSFTIVPSGGSFSGPGGSTTVTDFYEVMYENATYSVGRTAPTIQTWTLPNATYGDSDFAPTAPQSNSSGLWTYTSSNTAVISVLNDGTFRVGNAGSAVITAAQVADGNYNAATITTTIIVDKAAQQTLSVAAVTGLRHGDTAQLSTTGGSGNGAITFTVASGPCSINGSTMTATGAGDCVITAEKETDSNFLSITSASSTITIAPRPVTVTVNDASIEVGSSTPIFTATVTGGHAGVTVDSMTLLFDGSSSVPTAVGTYTVTIASVTLTGGTANDFTVITASGSFVITSQSQQALTLSGPTNVTVGSSITMIVTGGSGAGAITLSVVSGTNCSIDGLQVKGINPGSCQVQAIKVGDSTYASTTSAIVTITVNSAATRNAINDLKVEQVSGTKFAIWDGPRDAVIAIADRSGSKVTETKVTNNQFDLSSLTPGRSYSFTVTTEGASWTTGFVMPVAQPISVTAKSVSSAANEMLVTWEQPGYAEKFRVTITPKGGTPITITTKDTSFQITALPGREYSVTVQAAGEEETWGTPKTFATRAPGASGTVETPLTGVQLTAVVPTTMTAKSVVLKTNSDLVGALQVRVTTNGKTVVRTCVSVTCAIASPSTGLQLITTMAMDSTTGIMRALPLAAIANVSRTVTNTQRIQLVTLAAVGAANGGRITVTGSRARTVAATLRAGGFSGPITVKVTTSRTTTAAWAPTIKK